MIIDDYDGDDRTRKMEIFHPSSVYEQILNVVSAESADPVLKLHLFKREIIAFAEHHK